MSGHEPPDDDGPAKSGTRVRLGSIGNAVIRLQFGRDRVSVFTVTIDEQGSATITPVTGDPFGDAEPTLPPAPQQGSAIHL
jgi:hypothetical protein